MSGRITHGRNPLSVQRAQHCASLAPVAYSQVKVILVTEGWTRLEHLGRGTLLTEGDLAFLPARALVSGVPLPVAETVTFYLDPQFLEQQLAWVRTVVPLGAAFRAVTSGTGPILTLRPSAMEHQTLIAQAPALAACDASTERVSLGLLGACLGFLARIEHVVSLPSSVLPRSEVRGVVAALRSDLALRWTIADLSRLMNLSSSQLTRVFNSSIGTSPMQVVTRLRIARLAELLMTTDWTVQRCAEAVGWLDPCYATRIMKRIYGITPSQYRKATRSQTPVGF